MKLILFSICILMILPVNGQHDTILLEDITISVTPFQNRLSEATGSLSLIQMNSLETGSTINIADQINTAPGVFMASGTYTTNRLTIRGIGSRTPYSSNRIRAYLDDIPLTDGDGISTIEDMDILGIGRVEILKGPASAIYGSGLGGVIRLNTIAPKSNGISLNLLSNAGSFNTWKNGLTLGYKNNTSYLIAGFSRASSDGYRENSKYKRNQLFIHGLTGKEKNQFTFHLVGTDLNAKIPSSLGLSDFRNTPWIAPANWLAIKGFEEYKKFTGGAGWTHFFNENLHNKLVLFSSWLDPYESRPFNILDEKSTSIGLRETLQLEKRKIMLQSGIEVFSEFYSWKIFETLNEEKGAELIHNNEYRSYGNLFGHINWKPLTKLIFEAGINLNVLDYKLTSIYNVDNLDQTGKYNYKPVFSPRLGLNYKFSGNHHFHTSAGHGFSPPSLEETLLPEGLINPDLRPETGWNIDAGFKGWLFKKHWYYDISSYTIFVRNMLVTKRISENTFTGINAGAARLSGIEIYSKINLNEPLSEGKFNTNMDVSLFLNNNRFTDFIDDEIDYSGKTLPGIPAQIIQVRINSEYVKTLHLMTEIRYFGKQLMNDANTELYENHLIANCRVSYKMHPATLPFLWNVNVGFNNLFNTRYASMILVNAKSFNGSEPRYFYPGLPRNFYVGLTLELQ